MSSPLRVFVADSPGPAQNWTELTHCDLPAVRLRARDLQQAQRSSQRLRTDANSVVLDLRVLIAEDRPAARRLMTTFGADTDGSRFRDSVHYVGTAEGLAGLIQDIYVAEVADGVTLIPVVPDQDVRTAGERALRVIKSANRRHRAA